MKQILKKLFCEHTDVYLIRWCIKHVSRNEPSCVVVEYQCENCSKYVYLYLYGQDKEAWIKAMEEYKHENFYCTR
jgi:hypothetical protein